MIIYKIENKITGKVYIGQTVRKLEQRFKEHCKKPRCVALYSAINKYGSDNFIVSVLETLENRNLLNEREQYWVSFYNSVSPNGYNLTSGGENGRIMAEETKIKLSKYMMGKIGKDHPGFGHKMSDIQRKAQSKRMKDRVISDKTRKNMSLGCIGRKNNTKKCTLRTETGELLEFNTIKEAAIFLGCTGSNLIRYIKNNRAFNNYKIIVKDK